MRANRGIDAARTAKLIGADNFFVKRLAHAVEALELVVAQRKATTRKMKDRRHRLSIVRCELREQHIARRQQPFGAGDIGYIGVNLAGVHREAVKPLHLRALDLAVPIGTLDQPHHDPAV